MSESRSASIEPVSRALRLLEALNRRPVTTVTQLHGELDLPKPTVVRLLQALIAEGYVMQLSRTAGYRLTARALWLSSGYRPREMVVDVAQPLMDRFTQKHKWPLYLATPMDLTMWIRYSTGKESLISPDFESGYQYRLSLLVSALGKAYLAFCPREEQRALIEPLIGTPDLVDGMVRDRTAITRLLREVRQKGYATTLELMGDRGRGLAVPVRDARRVIGAISMRHFRSALRETDAVKRYLGPMQQLSTEISLGLSEAKRAAGVSRRTATPREEKP